MSVSVEQPLHFSHQPSSPSLPQSPTHILRAHTPTSHQSPPPSTDTDMSTSVPTLPPAGQSHERDNADMQDEALAIGRAEETRNVPSSRDASTNTIAVEISAVDEDIMDTTPDGDTQLVLPNGSVDANDGAIETPISPAQTAAVIDEPDHSGQAPIAPADDAPQIEDAARLDPPPPADANAQPPPPPPPVEPIRSETDSSDDDDGAQPWHAMPEDLSAPDEDEVKEMEQTTEHSALDHEYWQTKAFLPLEEPEYTAGESGRIHWSIDAYNGTREKPNKEIVMKSEIVTIGGHQWQIKFYPKGNDSDYLSVYLECLSVMSPKDETDEEASKQISSGDAQGSKEENDAKAMVMKSDAPTDNPTASAPVEAQHAPLPLLGSKTMPKRKCVAAQVSVVLYNPTEPRVHYSRTALHRFCSGSPDWGWTRFHGPYYDIAHRMRGQRQALLRDDKLAFTAYVRVVEDETGCLWEHHSRENPWDSFAMTGLQGLVLGENASAPGGNFISAVAVWMLFKPFRKLLYSIKLADPDEEPFTSPKPLVSALQKVLYMLRTQVEPDAGAIALDDIMDALEWYGIHERLDKLDVMETWELLRLKLEEELQNTQFAGALQTMCGPKRDYFTGVPTYRVPVVGVDSMQNAIDKSANFTVPDQSLPELLTIELERQQFDLKTRSYVKVLNKVTLDDRIAVNGVSYILYGSVVHKQTLQSYVYQPILRPEGPGSRWYSYSDSKDENQVTCLTKHQAVDAHEGKPGSEQVVGNDAVAYVVLYVREDVAQLAFTSDAASEQWDAPEWIKNEVQTSKVPGSLPPMPPPPVDEPTADAKGYLTVERREPTTLGDFRVVDSRVFLEHEGPGFFDAFDAKWDPSFGITHTVQLSSTDSCTEVRDKLVQITKDIRDPRQVKFWFLDPKRGILGRPKLSGTGKIEFSSGSHDRYAESKDFNLGHTLTSSRRIWIWVHVTDFDKLPELPKEEPKTDQETEEPHVAASPGHDQPAQDRVDTQVELSDLEPIAITRSQNTLPQSEDTPMSEPDEPVFTQSEPLVSPTEVPPTAINETNDTAMAEVESVPVVDPPAVDVVVPSTTVPGDTEMGGTQEELPPPPPPPAEMPAEPIQPPPPARTPTPEPPPDEIYFFLKYWDPEKQALESRGSHISLKQTRVDEALVTLLGLPAEDKKRIELWEEEELCTLRPLKHRRTFAQVDLHNTSIVVVALPTTTEQRSALAARAAFADPQSYLQSRIFARNFPHKLSGYFTYSYFSGQYYKGEITNGHRHGHGTRTYHSGATYTGAFRLSSRHGHGFYTFQNGDTYDGEWVDNQQHGLGTFVESATGNTYTGGWKQDKKFGEGVTHWKNAEESERLCRICWDGPAEAAFYDCGHVVACLGCAREVQSCPVCRKRVLTAMKLYYVA